ncbi:MAG: hypothetical protein QXM75_02470 [Candidatus Diapherotrites archaeon]
MDPSKIVNETARKITRLEIQGSSNVRKAVVSALKQSIILSKAQSVPKLRSELARNILLLAKARPTEPETKNTLTKLWEVANQELKLQELKLEIVNACDRFERDRLNSVEKIVAYAKRELKNCETIFTHCHSSTVERILVELSKSANLKNVICTETRPLFQGRITAKNLTKAGIKCTMIVDSAARAFIHKADVFLTGCDAIFYDGSVVNKIGTSQISLAAKKIGVPHYVASVSFCFDPATYYGLKTEIEERSYKEVWPDKPKALQIKNPAFDVTEPELVRAIICEHGVFSPKKFVSLMVKKLALKEKPYLTLEERMKKYLTN